MINLKKFDIDDIDKGISFKVYLFICVILLIGLLGLFFLVKDVKANGGWIEQLVSNNEVELYDVGQVYGQSFTTLDGTAIIKEVWLKLRGNGTADGDFLYYLRQGSPTGTIIKSGISANLLVPEGEANWVEVVELRNQPVSSEVKYWIGFRHWGASGEPYPYWQLQDGGNPYADGGRWDVGGSENGADDFTFKIKYSFDPTLGSITQPIDDQHYVTNPFEYGTCNSNEEDGYILRRYHDVWDLGVEIFDCTQTKINADECEIFTCFHIRDQDLISYWDFDEGTGDTVYDETVNENNGTLIGNSIWVDGLFENAVHFDNTGDYIDFGTDVGTLLGDDVTDISIKIWFKKDVLNGNDGIFSIGSFTGNAGELSLYLFSNKIYFTMNGITFSESVAFSDIDLWHSLLVTYDGVSGKLYLDDVLVINEPYVSNLDLTGLKTVVGAYYNSTYSFDGRIDGVYIYDVVLTPANFIGQWDLYDHEYSFGTNLTVLTDNNNEILDTSEFYFGDYNESIDIIDPFVSDSYNLYRLGCGVNNFSFRINCSEDCDGTDFYLYQTDHNYSVILDTIHTDTILNSFDRIDVAIDSGVSQEYYSARLILDSEIIAYRNFSVICDVDLFGYGDIGVPLTDSESANWFLTLVNTTRNMFVSRVPTCYYILAKNAFQDAEISAENLIDVSANADIPSMGVNFDIPIFKWSLVDSDVYVYFRLIQVYLLIIGFVIYLLKRAWSFWKEQQLGGGSQATLFSTGQALSPATLILIPVVLIILTAIYFKLPTCNDLPANISTAIIWIFTSLSQYNVLFPFVEMWSVIKSVIVLEGLIMSFRLIFWIYNWTCKI